MSKKNILYCSSSGICTVHVLIHVLFLFRYLHCRSFSTPSHPVLEGSTINRYLQSHMVPILHVIWYPYSMSSSTHFLRYQYYAHSILQVIWYQKVLQVIWYSHSMSSGTHTPCHTVLTLHIIRYSQFNTSSTRMFQKPSGTRMLQVIRYQNTRYQHQQQSGTRNNSKFWKASRGKSGTWVFSRMMFSCGHVRLNSSI
jgi:hypothetical protein